LGRVGRLEGFCVAHGLPFARWSGGSAAQFGPERAVFIGMGEARLYGADEEDAIVISMDRAERLGSYKAIMAYFTAADFFVPVLRFVT
jgi:hypothetical protein